jgi:endoglucanase
MHMTNSTARRSLRAMAPAILAVHALAAAAPPAQGSSAVSPPFRINQIGYYGPATKVAAVVSAAADDFYVVNADRPDTVFRGKLSAEALWDASQEKARLADFSALQTPGRYVLAVPGLGVSDPFPIGSGSQLELVRGSIRAFYYQRASTALDKAHAGKWARDLGHPDRRVAVHPSAASAARPANVLIASPRGWYDAGDYGKYIVNSGITTYTLLSLYRHHPSLFDTLNLNIPESGDALPDLLDEVLWNLRWMLTMQDGDGGVYHKLTTANFSGMVMPAADVQTRYVVRKSVTAALNFAAVAAYASRTFRKFETQLPGFADTALTAARRAWEWARANPTAYYNQAEIKAAYTPPIETGEYGDKNALDEFQWAGTELYLATREDSFYVAAYPTALPTRIGVPGWNSVAALAFYSMADEGGAEHPLIDTATVRLRLREAATLIRTATDQNAFRVPMQFRDFYWGSNSVCANMGILLMQAYRATGDASFLRPALDALDYLLGRNGPGISFVTGFGTRSPRHPHHRPSEADGIPEPVPGFLVGGPNSGQQDKQNCAYPSTLPALSYSDAECSYASNEVAINWNAPLAYLSGALHALFTGASVPQSIGPSGRGHGRIAALLTWEGNGPRLVMPKGLRGRLELFDGRGRAWMPGTSGRDSAGTGGNPPPLLFFRLHVEGGKGPGYIRTGSWPASASLRIPI